MVVQLAAIPIVTAVGEFAAPYLIKEATKLGIKKFIQNYGSTAFQAISAGVVGGMIEQVTAPLDLQTEKILGMPVSRITGQEQVYSDIEEPTKVKPLEYIPTVHGGEELPPIKAEPFPAKTEVEPVQEGFKVPEKIETIKGLEIPPQEIKIPPGIQKAEPLGTDILTKDIVKQTKDLVTKEPEFGALTETEKQTALAIKGDKPDFYSRAIKSIEDAKPDKLTKTKWKSYIQSTKEELDYLGLTEFLKGNESITKQELLDFVKGKDLAATMTVRSIPKNKMNPMYEDYSLGFEQSGTKEHIVFQKDPEQDYSEGTGYNLYEEPHFDKEHALGTFAHARVQVGFGDSEAPPADYEDLDPKVFDKFDNTLIIDEIQSQWIQTGQDKGFVSDFSTVNDTEKELTEFLNKNNIKYKIQPGQFEDSKDTIKIYDRPDHPNERKRYTVTTLNQDKWHVFNKKGRYVESYNISAPEDDRARTLILSGRAVPDLPIKDSKKFVELVLNEMIRKAVTDGRDSIAITNGQIQYNRYEAQEEKNRQGLKKFYDTFVYDQLNKIAKNYNVELERINISEGSEMASQEVKNIRLDSKIKIAQDNNNTLQKITLQELWDAVKGEEIPDHASFYSNLGKGQGAEYIENYLNAAVTAQRDVDRIRERTGDTTDWSALRHNEVYVWKMRKEDKPFFMGETGASGIIWDMPIIPINDTSAITGENDLSIYTEYLKTWKSPCVA